MRHLLLAVVVAMSTPVAADSKWEPSETPIHAPAECVAPISGGITAPIKRGARRVGVYRLVNGKSLDTPRLRLKAYGRFIPERLGSSRGEVMASFEAALLPDVVRDGENPDNSKFDAAPGVLRILNYRVTLRTVSTAPLAYDAIVDDVGCPEESTDPPLGLGESKTFWVSTDGVMKFSLSKVPWYMSGDRLQATLSTSLGPDVQQTDRANPFGYVMLNVFEGRDGRPSSTELVNDQIAGAKATLLDYELEVLRVVWGKDTTLVSGKLITKGNLPAASVLVKVSRPRVTPRGY